MRALLLLVLLSSVLAEESEWLDLDARMAYKDAKSVMCKSKQLNYRYWPNSGKFTDFTYEECLEECERDPSACGAFSYWETDKTCKIKVNPTGQSLSNSDINGQFNQTLDGVVPAITSYHADCPKLFEPVDSSVAAKTGFCTIQGFRLAGTEVASWTKNANTAEECLQKCTDHGDECTAFSITDNYKCTLYGDGYSVLYCSNMHCYSGTKGCYSSRNWTSVTPDKCRNTVHPLWCAKSVDLTSRDILLEYIAYEDLNYFYAGFALVHFWKVKGQRNDVTTYAEMGTMGLYHERSQRSGGEDSLWLEDCDDYDAKNPSSFYKSPWVSANEVRRFIISINSTGISVRGQSQSNFSSAGMNPMWLLWDDVFETDPGVNCSKNWNVSEIAMIGFESWEPYNAMWTTVESRAGIVGLSAVIMIVWAVIMA